MSLATQSLLTAKPSLLVRPRQNVRRPARMIVRAQDAGDKLKEGAEKLKDNIEEGLEQSPGPKPPTSSGEAKSLFDQVDDFGRKLSKETQEASGLDAKKLGQQPGDKTGVQFGKEDTPKGEIGQVMSFAGLLPEITNGRAAMVAMLAAFGAELGTHQPVPVQIQKGPLLVVGAFLLVIGGSLAPVIRGANLDRNGFGPFNQRAEIWNGRLAMVAFTVLLLIETFRDGPALVP